jgi:hypothetical protein
MEENKKHKKRSVLSLQEKLSLINEVESGTATQEMVAKKYNLSQSSVSRVLKLKKNIKQAVNESSGGVSSNRKTLRKAQQPQLEKALYAWILQQREFQNVVTNNLIRRKAEVIFEGMVDQYSDVFGSFKSSNGWLQNFSKRYRLHMLALSGEKASTDESAFEEFKVRKKQTNLLEFS